MADRRRWPALLVQGGASSPAASELVSATLDDFAPIAIQDLDELTPPPGGLWDPTIDPVPDAPAGPLRWRVFFTSADDRDRARAAVALVHPELTLTPEEIVDEDWAARSQRSLSAIRAGSFIVAPPWDVPASIPNGATLIVIEPSRGFGTGHHPSTRLCLRALSLIPLKDRRVLDVGTGSGVLAMAASLSGAREVRAIDLDADAIDAARTSAALNPALNSIDWVVGDFREARSPLLDRPWDLVVANLTGGMLIVSAARLRDLLAPGGVLVASGFDLTERDGVEAALGMRVRERIVEDGWAALVAALR